MNRKQQRHAHQVLSSTNFFDFLYSQGAKLIIYVLIIIPKCLRQEHSKFKGFLMNFIFNILINIHTSIHFILRYLMGFFYCRRSVGSSRLECQGFEPSVCLTAGLCYHLSTLPPLLKATLHPKTLSTKASQQF